MPYEINLNTCDGVSLFCCCVRPSGVDIISRPIAKLPFALPLSRTPLQTLLMAALPTYRLYHPCSVNPRATTCHSDALPETHAPLPLLLRHITPNTLNSPTTYAHGNARPHSGHPNLLYALTGHPNLLTPWIPNPPPSPPTDSSRQRTQSLFTHLRKRPTYTLTLSPHKAPPLNTLHHEPEAPGQNSSGRRGLA